MPPSIFGGTLRDGWGPKTPEGRKLAGRLVMRHLLRETGCRSIEELQRYLCPIAPTADGKRRRRKSWTLYVEGRMQQRRTLDMMERHARGARAIVLHPLWRILASKRPVVAWKRHVLPSLQPHIRGIWTSLNGRSRVGSLVIRRWMREASRHSTLDSLCMLAGLVLLLLERGQGKKAIAATNAMIRILIVEHSTFPLSPYVWHLFDACKASLWQTLPDTYLKGYDFRVACAAAEPMRALMMSSPEVFRRLSVDSILLPGDAWKVLPPPSNPERQFFRLRYSAIGGRDVVREMMEGVGKQAEPWPGPIDNVPWQECFRLEKSRQKRVHDRLFLERIDGQELEMAIVPELLRRPFSASVRFLGYDAGEDQWLDAPRTPHPRKNNLMSSHPEAQFEAAARGAQRSKFRRFPSNGRLLYIGINFQPV